MYRGKMNTEGIQMEKMNTTAMAYLLGTSIFYGLLIVVQKKGLESGVAPMEFSFARSLVVILISLVYFSPQLRCLKLPIRIISPASISNWLKL